MATEPRLSDAEVLNFVVHGWHIVQPELPAGTNERIWDAAAALEQNPGNGIWEAIPALTSVYESPEVVGALKSLLGEEMRMNAHRHLHVTPANHPRSQGWHQDGTNVRHHQIRTVLAMYYPQKVTAQNGPTVLLPGSHFRNAPTDRMATYANIKGQKFVTVPAGAVAIVHYDIWHAATLNRTDRPRFMFKFLFDRTSPPKAPSWNHDPDAARDAEATLLRQATGPLHYNSDFYKEWELRQEMWTWLLGRAPEVPPGHFKDMLG